MDEVSVPVRIRIIKKLGTAINDSMCMDITGSLVYELVLQLDPADEIKDNEHYVKYNNPIT